MRALVLIGVLALTAGGCVSTQAPFDSGTPALRPVSQPDLARVTEPVQAQVRAQYESLTEKQSNPQTAAAALAGEYGALGMLLMAAEFRDQAEAALLNAEALAPGERRWPYYLAHLYKAKGDTPNATAAFERALRLAPQDVPTLLGLGDANLDLGRADAAERLFAQALSLQPRSAAARYALGRAALAKQDYRQAAERFEEALAIDGAPSVIHYSLAMAYKGQGDRQQAEAHLQQRGAREIHPDDPLLTALADVLHSAVSYETHGEVAFNTGDNAGAADYFRKGIALAPERPSLHYKLGTVLVVMGDRTGALEHFDEAVRLSPGFAEAHDSLGLIYQSRADHQHAIESFTTAVASQPDYLPARLHLAHAVRRNGQYARSLSLYEQVIRLDASALDARFGYVAALIRLGRYQEARDRLTEAMDRYPDEWAFAGAMARVLAAAPDDRVRDARRALALAQGIVNRQPRTIEVAETMAMALAAVAEYAEAVTWQRGAIDAAERAGRPDLARRLAENLRLYEARRPSRRPWRADEPIEFESPKAANGG